MDALYDNIMEPSEIIKSIDHASAQGPWWLFIAMLVVLLGGVAIIFKVMFTYFKEQGQAKDVIIKSFSEAWDRQTNAFNRRTKSDNARTEMEALQFAARADLHPELKSAANQIIQKIKDQNEEDESGHHR